MIIDFVEACKKKLRKKLRSLSINDLSDEQVRAIMNAEVTSDDIEYYDDDKET